MKSFFNYAKNRILYNIFRFLFFLIVALILLSSKVNALETNFENLEVYGYNNNGNNLTYPSVFGCSEGSCGMEITTVANSYGGAWGIQSPIPILQNHNYSLSLRIRSSQYAVTLSSKPQLSIGSSLVNARERYQSSNYYTTLRSYRDAGNSTLQYYFKANTNASYVLIPFTTTTTVTANFMIDSIVIEDLGTESLTDQEVNNIINNQTAVIQGDINNIQSSLNDVENSINDTITDNFESCDFQEQKFYYNNSVIKDYYLDSNGNQVSDTGSGISDYISIEPNTPYNIMPSSNILNLGSFCLYDFNKYLISCEPFQKRWSIDFDSGNAKFIRITFTTTNAQPLILSKKVCSNRLDNLNDTQKETNEKLEEANKTSKGIWDTLKDLPKTILDGFLDLLLEVFVPDDDFFSNWFDEVKSMFEEQLGFLATPFTIIIEFIERFLDLNSSTNIIINIPDITVPNFENITLIKATSFNWSNLLNSKDSLKNLWTLYLDFIDVFLILNFIGLCSSIYGRIFGGDTSNFEYYTVEDTYTVNDSTGEVTNHRLNQRKTTRKKVN